MEKYTPVIVFASGGPNPDEGGSGFDKLAEAVEVGNLHVKIVAVVSNHPNGGVKTKADKHGIPFVYFRGPWTAENYRTLVAHYRAEFVFLSGWLKPVRGCDPRRTINIHPGLLPDFGGQGMYGHHVHEATIDAFESGGWGHSAVTMHFVTSPGEPGEPKNYDTGPVFFQFLVPIVITDGPDTLAKRVNSAEHYWQWRVTEWVIQGLIHWDGVDPRSLKVEIPNYPFLPVTPSAFGML